MELKIAQLEESKREEFKKFKSAQIKVISQYCIAHPYCARFLRH